MTSNPDLDDVGYEKNGTGLQRKKLSSSSGHGDDDGGEKMTKINDVTQCHTFYDKVFSNVFTKSFMPLSPKAVPSFVDNP
jgi:hypothetical protein